MKRNFNNNAQTGFTLIEVLVSMALFIIVMVIATESFNRIITQSSKFSKMEESNIEGVIGLEVMRHDLEQMGFGLPWSWSERTSTAVGTATTDALQLCGLTYSEATDATGLALNDAPHSVPRAFVARAKLGTFSSAYIAVKGTTVGRAKASQRWTYIPFMNYSANPRESRPVAFSSNNPQVNNMVLMVNSNPIEPDFDRSLIVEPGSNAASSTDSIFSVAFKTNGTISDNYLPTEKNPTYMVYGLLDDNTPDPRMPFNRADFFIGRNLDGNIVPPFCAPRTGVLYKATVNHGSSTGGDYNYIPLLDCVADMQVVLGWDPVESRPATNPKNSRVDAYSSLPTTAGGDVSTVFMNSEGLALSASTVATKIKGWLSDPKGLREQLKIVKVYILAQEGKVDRNYRPNPPITSIVVGDTTYGASFAKTYNFSAEQQLYRWKLYQIVIRPKNIVSNS